MNIFRAVVIIVLSAAIVWAYSVSKKSEVGAVPTPTPLVQISTPSPSPTGAPRPSPSPTIQPTTPAPVRSTPAPVVSPMPSSQPTPAPTDVTREVKVWMLQYLPPEGVRARYPLADVADAVSFTRNTLIPAMNNASRYHGYANRSAVAALNYTLSDSNITTESNPPPSRGDNYLNAPAKADDQPGYLDLSSIFQRHGICQRAKEKNIGMVILWTAGSGAYAPKGFESYVTGNKGIPTNGPILSGSAYCDDKTILILGLNYERGLAEALESYGHHLEAVFRRFRPEYWSWEDRDSCGNDHNPPNSRFEYDRSNTASFQSDCRTWKPDGSASKETLSCSTWDCTAAGWLNFWMQNMPGVNNGLIGTDGKQIPNWWVYIGDPDNCVNNPLGC